VCTLVIAGCNATILLHASKEALNLVAITIQVQINLALLASIAPRGDHWLDLLQQQIVDKLISIVGFIAQQRAGFVLAEELLGQQDVTAMTWTQQQTPRVAQSIDGDMQFRRQPASAASESFVVLGTFF
jgi:hypothetical protein